MKKFCVIFDMDGTLLDTQRIYVDAWDLAGEHQGLPNLGRHIAFVCGMNEIGWGNFLAERYPSLDLPTFKREVVDYVTAHLEVKFMPGAQETLDFLKQEGVPIAVASGTDTPTVRAHMEHLNAAHYFDAFIGGEQVQNGKPAPDIFLKAAEALGYAPEDCFVVEDSANGIRAGYAAGMKCIGIPDLAIFDEDVHKMLFAKLTDLSQTIPLFEHELKKERA